MNDEPARDSERDSAGEDKCTHYAVLDCVELVMLCTMRAMHIHAFAYPCFCVNLIRLKCSSFAAISIARNESDREGDRVRAEKLYKFK